MLVFLHDIGKANAGFQSRRWQAPERVIGVDVRGDEAMKLLTEAWDIIKKVDGDRVVP